MCWWSPKISTYKVQTNTHKTKLKKLQNEKRKKKINKKKKKNKRVVDLESSLEATFDIVYKAKLCYNRKNVKLKLEYL